MNTDRDIDAAAIRSGAGVPQGELLVRFVDASYADADALAMASDEIVDRIGAEALVDVAAVVANFHMMTRIADGTGTPIDDGSAAMSRQLTADLGIDGFVSRRLDPTIASAD